MPLRAMRFASVILAETVSVGHHSTPHVLLGRHNLDVVRVNAGTAPAHMVALLASTHPTNNQLLSHPVGKLS